MEANYIAFVGSLLVATGSLDAVREATRPWADNATGPLLIFNLTDGEQTDLDWRPVSATTEKKPGPGRPKLGVVSAEVTLLPRHWAWLTAQPSGASGTLRRLVDDALARAATDPVQRLRVLAKVLAPVAGNEPGFEEAIRALYAGDRARLEREAARWSGDLPAFVGSWS
ncbi:MAG: DUF2239 family protein [Spirochaetales bacterium]